MDENKYCKIIIINKGSNENKVIINIKIMLGAIGQNELPPSTKVGPGWLKFDPSCLHRRCFPSMWLRSNQPRISWKLLVHLISLRPILIRSALQVYQPMQQAVISSCLESHNNQQVHYPIFLFPRIAFIWGNLHAINL